MRRFLADRRGTTAIEFAVVAPVLLAITFGTMGLGWGIWMSNILQQVAAETARCVAIDSPACAADARCPSGICFAMELAVRRGLSGLDPERIEIDPARLVDDILYAEVTIHHEIAFEGWRIPIDGTARFPRQGQGGAPASPDEPAPEPTAPPPQTSPQPNTATPTHPQPQPDPHDLFAHHPWLRS